MFSTLKVLSRKIKNVFVQGHTFSNWVASWWRLVFISFSCSSMLDPFFITSFHFSYIWFQTCSEVFVSVTSQRIEVALRCGKSTSLSPKILQSFKANEIYWRKLFFSLVKALVSNTYSVLQYFIRLSYCIN